MNRKITGKNRPITPMTKHDKKSTHRRNTAHTTRQKKGACRRTEHNLWERPHESVVWDDWGSTHTVLHHGQPCLPCWSVQEAAMCKTNISDFMATSFQCKQSELDKRRWTNTLCQHILNHVTRVAKVQDKCIQHTSFSFFFLVFRSTSSFLEVSSNSRSLAELCGKKNDPVCLCQNKPPFLSLDLDRPAPPEGNLLAPQQQYAAVMHPLLPAPSGLFVPPASTQCALPTAGSWEKGWDGTCVINTLSQ